MSKYFLVNPNIQNQDKEVLEDVRRGKEISMNDTFVQQREKDSQKLSQKDNLKHVKGRVIVKVDIDSKDSHTFADGTKIEYARRFNNLDRNHTQPVNAIVISGEGIKKGAEIIVHFNSIHDSNRIFDYKDGNDKIQYYSIHEGMCFAWHDGKEWLPLPPYDFGLRVFQPYEGKLYGIAPKLLKDTLFVTTGGLKNKTVKTISHSDMQIVFQDKNGREGNLIRFRPFGDEKNQREEESIAVLEDITDKILSGEYLIGMNSRDAKSIQEYFKYDRP